MRENEKATEARGREPARARANAGARRAGFGPPHNSPPPPRHDRGGSRGRRRPRFVVRQRDRCSPVCIPQGYSGPRPPRWLRALRPADPGLWAFGWTLRVYEVAWAYCCGSSPHASSSICSCRRSSAFRCRNPCSESRPAASWAHTSVSNVQSAAQGNSSTPSPIPRSMQVTSVGSPSSHCSMPLTILSPQNVQVSNRYWQLAGLQSSSPPV